jgi:hypothetical protein
MVDSYYNFGLPDEITKKMSDPVQCCLAGKYMNCPENNARFDLTKCNYYMAQRCASNWDDKCDLYLQQNIEPSFLEQVIKYKYCILDESDPNNKCIKVCEPFNNSAPYSPLVCSYYGSKFLPRDSKLFDLAGDFSATAKLRDTSPVKYTDCAVTCNNFKEIPSNDKVLDLCLRDGNCSSVLQHMAIYAKVNNIPVNHEGFKKFMNSYVNLPTKYVSAAPILPPPVLQSSYMNIKPQPLDMINTERQLNTVENPSMVNERPVVGQGVPVYELENIAYEPKTAKTIPVQLSQQELEKIPTSMSSCYDKSSSSYKDEDRYEKNQGDSGCSILIIIALLMIIIYLIYKNNKNN